MTHDPSKLDNIHLSGNMLNMLPAISLSGDSKMSPPVEQKSAIESAHQTNKATRRAIGCLALIVLLSGGGIWLSRAINHAHEAVHETVCRSNLNQIQMAFLNYHDTYGSFPPAYVVNEHGERMHSWRVLILPFIDQDEVYEQYHFDEPWNSPHNRSLEREINLDMFHCPSGPLVSDSPLTNYVLVTGAGTAFPGANTTNREGFEDGTENTILLVEIADSDIHWMEPRDLEIESMSFAVNDPQNPGISSPHPRGPAVVFADRITAYRLDQSLRPETVKALLTISGGEGVTKDDLFGHSENRNSLAEEPD